MVLIIILLEGGILIIVMLWDFDGVVVNTPHEEAWRKTALKYGIRDFTSEFYHRYVSGRPRSEGARAILEYYGLLRDLSEEDANRLVLEFAEEKNRVFNELVSNGLYSVNYEVLDFIERTRYLPEDLKFIHVLASASKNVIALSRTITVNEKRIIEYFDIDVSGSASTKKGVFENGVRRVFKADCYLAVDDAPSGMTAALELNVIPIGYRARDLLRYGASLVVDSFKNIELKVIIELCRQRLN